MMIFPPRALAPRISVWGSSTLPVNQAVTANGTSSLITYIQLLTKSHGCLLIQRQQNAVITGVDSRSSLLQFTSPNCHLLAV